MNVNVHLEVDEETRRAIAKHFDVLDHKHTQGRRLATRTEVVQWVKNHMPPSYNPTERES